MVVGCLVSFCFAILRFFLAYFLLFQVSGVFLCEA